MNRERKYILNTNFIKSHCNASKEIHEKMKYPRTLNEKYDRERKVNMLCGQIKFATSQEVISLAEATGHKFRDLVRGEPQNEQTQRKTMNGVHCLNRLFIKDYMIKNNIRNQEEMGFILTINPNRLNKLMRNKHTSDLQLATDDELIRIGMFTDATFNELVDTFEELNEVADYTEEVFDEVFELPTPEEKPTIEELYKKNADLEIRLVLLGINLTVKEITNQLEKLEKDLKQAREMLEA